jgi:hypothetical protein
VGNIERYAMIIAAEEGGSIEQQFDDVTSAGDLAVPTASCKWVERGS